MQNCFPGISLWTNSSLHIMMCNIFSFHFTDNTTYTKPTELVEWFSASGTYFACATYSKQSMLLTIQDGSWKPSTDGYKGCTVVLTVLQSFLLCKSVSVINLPYSLSSRQRISSLRAKVVHKSRRRADREPHPCFFWTNIGNARTSKIGRDVPTSTCDLIHLTFVRILTSNAFRYLLHKEVFIKVIVENPVFIRIPTVGYDE